MALPLALIPLLVLPLQDPASFPDQAKALREAESWGELAALAAAEADQAQDDVLPLSYLAIARAGLKEFEAAAEALQQLKQGGLDLDAAVPGLGSPLVEVVNTTYSHCWANFDPAFNRQCWEPLFARFADSHYAPVAASRLLMAALKEGDEAAAAPFRAFFDQRLEAARAAGDEAQVADLTGRLVDGHLKAGVSDAAVAALAAEAWDQAWSAAVQRHGYDGPVTGGDLDAAQLAARLQCELDTDDAFNTLARATALAGAEVGPGHPLYEMEDEPAVRFTDVTAALGLDGLKAGRVAAADFDADGDPDLCFGGRLYRNEDGRYTEVGGELGVTQRGAAALFGDADGDGLLDLLVAGGKPFLYRNLGKKGKYAFEDATAAAGLGAVSFAATPEGAAWVDFDDDGDLDLYFAVYEKPMGKGNPDVLLENDGDGVFTDASAKLAALPEGDACGRGVSPADVDQDGDSEIFVSNYRLNPNLLWQWDGAGLSDRSAALGVKGERQPADGAYFGHTIGSCWGDVDGDGDLDLFSANLAHPRFIRQGFSNLSFLGIQQEDGSFRDERAARGVRFQETHSDPALVDIDNDGDLDLSLTCIYEGVPSALFQNDGAGHFSPITFRAGAVAFHGWGQSWLDFDGDGFLDVVYASSAGVRAFRNSGNDNHYVRVALQTKGRDLGYGAVVQVEGTEEDAPPPLTRQLFAARGTSSQDEPVLHFGLGGYDGKIRIRVRWPDSDKTESKTPKPDRLYRFKQTRKAK